MCESTTAFLLSIRTICLGLLGNHHSFYIHEYAEGAWGFRFNQWHGFSTFLKVASWLASGYDTHIVRKMQVGLDAVNQKEVLNSLHHSHLTEPLTEFSFSVEIC